MQLYIWTGGAYSSGDFTLAFKDKMYLNMQNYISKIRYWAYLLRK